MFSTPVAQPRLSLDESLKESWQQEREKMPVDALVIRGCIIHMHCVLSEASSFSLLSAVADL